MFIPFERKSKEVFFCGRSKAELGPHLMNCVSFGYQERPKASKTFWEPKKQVWGMKTFVFPSVLLAYPERIPLASRS